MYSPKLWGRQGWHFIHMVALAYPPEQLLTDEIKQKYYNFFESLGYVLPCPTCSNNYKEKFQKNPPRLKNRTELFQWTVDIHNSVNKSNGKKQLTYEQAYAEIVKKDFFLPYLLIGISFSVSAITLIRLLKK